MKAFLLNLGATFIVAGFFSLVAWLAISGIASFVALEWRMVTDTPHGRLVFIVVTLWIFAKTWAGKANDD